MTLTDEHRRVNMMILRGQSFDAIEDHINALALPSAHLAALWLLAWTEATDAETRSRLIAQTLSDLGSESRSPEPCVPKSPPTQPEAGSSARLGTHRGTPRGRRVPLLSRR